MPTSMNWERWAPLSGIAFVALIVATFFFPSDQPPNSRDSAGEVVAWFTDHRSAILTGSFLGGLAIVFFVWFLGSLATRLREGGEMRLGGVAFGGGVLLAAVALGSLGVQSVLAYRLAEVADAEVVRALWQVEYLTFAYAFPLAVLVGAVSVATLRSHLFPRWFGAAGAVGALWFVVGGAAYADSGFFAPDGGYALVTFIAFLVWVLVASGLMLTRVTAPVEMGRPVTAS